MIRVCAPATSANLGCGFDTMGLAVSMSNVYEIEETDNGFFCGGKEEKKDGDNLIVQSIFSALEETNYNIKGFNLNVQSDIPSARGLGSSSSCICAGLAMGYALSGLSFDREKIFQRANKLEGHPDNVAPCVFGGAVLSFSEKNTTYHTKLNIHKKFKLCAFIPDFRLSTAKARGALPSKYERSDIVFNVSRAALLPLALERGDSSFLKYALQDKIHQPYRKKFINNYDEIFALSEKCGLCGMYLSGAGPTLMGIYDEGANLALLREEMKKYPDWEVKLLDFNRKGMSVETK